ncbi:SDR family oxidoreductase [Patulibacter minatonensis]|uniref:SDR family oxidoreductase n=1 Tax=Patulibacter minatonensis TaxID=298163 RepID=UPI000479DBFD|nr:SDR family oxidoreductase [Patulibacter minatonensis]
MTTEKTVLITGASSGIGAATARVLAEAGHRVVLGARRTDRLDALVAELREGGATASARRLDVTDAADVVAFVEAARDEHGRVDVLINNAGVMPLSPLESLLVDQWDAMIDVNLRGLLHGIAAALPVMRAQGSGQLITVASIGAHLVVPTSAVYSATKFAAWAVTEGLRQEVGDRIRVTTISPGVTESELASTITDPDAAAAMVEYRRDALPASAVARAIAYAIDQPDDVDVNEIVVRPTAQV